MSHPIRVTDTEGTSIQISFDDKQLIIEHTDKKQLILFDSIYAVVHSKAESLLSIFAALKDEMFVNTRKEDEPASNSQDQSQTWHLKRYNFRIDQDRGSDDNMPTDTTVDFFIEQLRERTTPHHSKYPNTKVYVFSNPTSGNQQSNNYWKDIVRPMLLTAGFQQPNIAKISTERAGKTRDLAEDLGRRIQSNEFDSDNSTDPIIICMGGDGTLHEVMNGLADAISDCNSETEQQQQRRFRLGIIPTGSGNAFALGLNLESIEQATLRIVKGFEEKPFSYMDVKFGHSQESSSDKDWFNQPIRYDETRKPIRLLVVLSWGFHAQVVSKARYLRYIMGNKRFSLIAMLLLLFLQQYDGELILKKNVKKYDPDKKAFISANDQESNDDNLVILDSNEEPQKKFTYFVVSKQHSLEKGFRIAPFASSLTDDLDIVLMRNASAQSLTKVSMAAFQGGEHIKSSDVEYYKAQELLLRVKDKAELCIDGEVVSLPAKGIVDVKIVTTEPTQFTIFV